MNERDPKGWTKEVGEVVVREKDKMGFGRDFMLYLGG